MDKRTKTVARIGALVVAALAAGHLVQTMKAEKDAAAEVQPESIEQVSAGTDPATEVVSLPKPAEESDVAMPDAAGAEMAAEPEIAQPADPVALPTMTIGHAAAPEVAPQADAPVLAVLPDSPAGPALPPEVNVKPDVPVASATAGACTPTMNLTPEDQAMISVSIIAPCRGGERVVLGHGELTIAEKMSPEGTLNLELPALQVAGTVSALFSDAEVLSATITIPEAASTHRFAIKWIAADTFQLHAFENGADYGQPGEVSAFKPISPNGGYLVSLGDPSLDLPMMAEIYTYPATANVELSIEATVTDITCARELLGEVVESRNGTITKNNLSLSMPECDALGDILVLKNPGQDVTLAAVN